MPMNSEGRIFQLASQLKDHRAHPVSNFGPVPPFRIRHGVVWCGVMHLRMVWYRPKDRVLGLLHWLQVLDRPRNVSVLLISRLG